MSVRSTGLSRKGSARSARGARSQRGERTGTRQATDRGGERLRYMLGIRVRMSMMRVERKERILSNPSLLRLQFMHAHIFSHEIDVQIMHTEMEAFVLLE